MELYRLSACSRRSSAASTKAAERITRSRVRSILLLLIASLSLATLFMSPNILGGARSSAFVAATAPVLLTQVGSTRGIALDSVTNLAEPFQPQSPVPFGTDNRTRVMLFATNLALAAGENASAVTADAEDVTRFHYPLAIEYVGAVPGQTWMTSVVVRLN